MIEQGKWKIEENKKSVTILNGQGHIIARVQGVEGNHQDDLAIAMQIVLQHNHLPTLERLQKQVVMLLAELTVMRWVSVAEKLPLEGDLVEAWTTGGIIKLAVYTDGRWYPQLPISYWREFEPPEQIDFFEMIRQDPDMTPEMKAHWLRMAPQEKG